MTRSGITFDTYLATGDSLTGGYYTSAADGSKRFVYLTASALQALGHASIFATHPNPGAGIDTALASLKSSLVRYEPQIMTVEWGINNLNLQMPAATFQAKYAELLDIILEGGPHRLVVCCNIPWFNYPYLGTLWYLALQYNTAIATEAASRGLPLADCWTATALHLEYLSNSAVTYYYPVTHVGDWAHPNDDGHAALYGAIWSVMQPALSNYRSIAVRSSATGRADATGRAAV